MWVIDALNRHGDRLIGISELATSIDLPRSTVHRILTALRSYGIVVKVGRRYGLTRQAEMQDFYNASLRTLVVMIRPHLAELYEQTRSVVALAVIDRFDVRFIDVLYPRTMVPLILRTSVRVPLHCTAAGRALLAFNSPIWKKYSAQENWAVRLTSHSEVSLGRMENVLSEVKLTGIAVESQEHIVGMTSAAVPLLNVKGRAVAAICTGKPVRAFQLPEVDKSLRRAATGCTRGLRSLMN
ncbi:helix-turn-helix domain-containing protein [Natronoglycomyces albus]|uniref:Helix-turn-helix domain-containing protein n=2 Tax=Natronoglycomyces albus TaxID=2811108 RepID=A0A895XW88_9ACTN|nr:helix-turn-helix domain-containing protein [Natronoglycomyces albus]